MMQRLILATMLALGGSMLLSEVAEARTPRHDAIDAVQLDEVKKRIDGKEGKMLKKQYPKHYASLKAFCKTAKKGKNPAAVGVTIPADAPKKSSDCKPKKVSKFFLMAWADQGKHYEKNEPKNDSPKPGKPGNVDRSDSDSGHPVYKDD